MADRMFIKIFGGRNYENEVWMELHLGFKLQMNSCWCVLLNGQFS